MLSFFFLKTGDDDPFTGVNVGTMASPCLVDINGDNLLDMFVGNDNGEVIFFQNEGTQFIPKFVRKTGEHGPLTTVDVGRYSSLAFGDLNGNGLMDVVIGDTLNNLAFFYKNTGSKTNPGKKKGRILNIFSSNYLFFCFLHIFWLCTVFTQKFGSDNPFDGIQKVVKKFTPTLADTNGDGLPVSFFLSCFVKIIFHLLYFLQFCIVY